MVNDTELPREREQMHGRQSKKDKQKTPSCKLQGHSPCGACVLSFQCAVMEENLTRIMP